MDAELASAIGGVYHQVRAPKWAAQNLDALSDVLRDLSWLPPGEVVIALSEDADARLRAVLLTACDETAAGSRPVRVLEVHPE